MLSSVRPRDPLSSSPVQLGSWRLCWNLSLFQSFIPLLHLFTVFTPRSALRPENARVEGSIGYQCPSLTDRESEAQRPASGSHTASRTHSSRILLNSRPEFFSLSSTGFGISVCLFSFCPEMRRSEILFLFSELLISCMWKK